MYLAPIAFFTYDRPEHTLKSLTALSECTLARESILYIFCDGPKTAGDRENVSKVREIVASRLWCGEVTIVVRENNAGLAHSVIEGVTKLCNEFGKVIVIEDDLLMSPYFLSFMNKSLEKYQENEQVFQVSGHMFDVRLRVGSDAIFLPFVTSWGWATWQRAWQRFNRQAIGYEALRDNINLQHRFNLDGNYDYFGMLQRQVNGCVDSWGILWNLSVFIQEGLVLYPVKSLIANMGFDGSGTNCRNEIYINAKIGKVGELTLFPDEITEYPDKEVVYKAIRNMYSPSFCRQLYGKLAILFGSGLC